MKKATVLSHTMCTHFSTKYTTLCKVVQFGSIKPPCQQSADNCPIPYLKLEHVASLNFYSLLYPTRYTCQICSRSFPKQQLLRDHMSRSHMQPNMPLVIQAAQPKQSSIGPVPAAGLDHVPSHSPPPPAGK